MREGEREGGRETEREREREREREKERKRKGGTEVGKRKSMLSEKVEMKIGSGRSRNL